MICNIARSLLKKSEDVIEFTFTKTDNASTYTDERLIGKKNFVLQCSDPYYSYYSTVYAVVIDGVHKALIYKGGEDSGLAIYYESSQTGSMPNPTLYLSIDSDTGTISTYYSLAKNKPNTIYAW